MVVMRDGIKLATDIYKSDSLKDGPVVLIRTPYNKSGIGEIVKFFTVNDYIVVVQDVRGKYMSEGNFIPFSNEISDGLETLDWISQQSWCNGNIVMWGSSYLGHAALVLSNSNHPNLKSIFSLSGWIDSQLINSPGGAFHQMLVIPWLIFEGQQSKVSLKGMDMDEIFNHTPLVEVIPVMDLDSGSSGLESLESASNLTNSFSYIDVNIPIMHVTGWYDFTAMASVDAYQKVLASSKSSQNILIGPWYHNQIYDENQYLGNYKLKPNSNTSLEPILEYSVEWFDRTIKKPHKSLSPEAQYYVLFEDKWRASQVWPPQGAQNCKFYFKKDSLFTTQYQEFIQEKGQTNFTYNPENPVPTEGGANFNFFIDKLGIKNQNQIEAREDVITFTSSFFKEDKIIAGSISTQLFIETNAKSTDFTAKLTKVDRDGNSWNLVDGITRIPIIEKSNSPLKVTIEMGDIAFLLKKGERLRVQISGGNFPKCDRNPNTGEDSWQATSFIEAQQIIHHSKVYPSFISIPFLK